MKPIRGWQYYFTTEALMLPKKEEGDLEGYHKRRAEFKDVAVDGSTVLAQASNNWVSLTISTIPLVDR